MDLYAANALFNEVAQIQKQLSIDEEKMQLRVAGVILSPISNFASHADRTQMLWTLLWTKRRNKKVQSTYWRPTQLFDTLILIVNHARTRRHTQSRRKCIGSQAPPALIPMTMA